MFLQKKFLTIFLLIFLCVISTTAYAQENKLTLEEAVDLAIKNSTQLKNDLYNIEKTIEVQTELYDNIKVFSPLPYYDPAEADINSRYQWAYFNSRLAQKKYEFDKIVVIAETKKKYYDTLTAINASRLAELEERNAKLALSHVLSKKSVGMATDLDVTQARVALEKAKAVATSSKAKTDETYNKLNDYLKLPIGSRFTLASNIDFEKLQDNNVQTYINKALNERLDYWKKSEEASVYERVVDLATIWKVGDINSKQAALDASETKEKIVRDVKKAYLDILSLEQRISTLTESQKLAEQALKMAEVQYTVGIITHSDKIKAEAKLMEAQNALYDAIYQHNLAKTSFPLLSGMEQSSDMPSSAQTNETL